MPGAHRTRAARHRRGAQRSKPLDAFVALLDRYGFTLHYSGAGIGEERLVSRIAGGSVPPAYLGALAERCGFEGLPLIRKAMEWVEARAAGPGDHAAASAAAIPAADLRVPGLDEAFSLVFASLGEERSGQLDMGRAVREVLAGGGVALLEAGTGTGKSLGYLVPSVLHSLETGERVIVSTHTRNLQDQLFRKEMRILEAALSIDVNAARLLGRDNYLCTKRVISHASSLAMETCAPALAFALFVSCAEGGTLDSLGALPGGLDPRSLAAPSRCPMNACGFAGRCPLVRARAHARDARILFVNHALLLTDYRQGGSVLGPYARVIFDEAHHLEKCIIENLSVKASRDDVRRILEPLRLSDAKDDAWRLISNELESATIPGGSKSPGRDIARAARDLEKAYADLFAGLRGVMSSGKSIRSTRTRYVDGGETFADARNAFNAIYSHINILTELLKPLHETKLPRDLEAMQQEMVYASEELATLAESLRFLSAGSGTDSVFWLDWGADGALREMCGSPLEVDRSFADYLEGILGSAVFTSATLSQNGSFALLRDRLGMRFLASKPRELVIPSPFPFDENCLVLVVSGLGDPNHEDFAAPVAELVAGLAAGVGRRTMVLFTSYRLCHSVADALADGAVERPLLVQGTGESREALSGKLRRLEGGVLLGVASFWEGVDFPGEELEVLVIPKIPFPVPAEPIVEARSQRLSSLGEDPFEKLFLPEAILRMRQGSGRLIRRMDDRGVIVILDSRLGVRPYAATILSSLPSRNVEHVTVDECVARAARWFAGG
jgi:ATP-dependent DNA helicase DinG